MKRTIAVLFLFFFQQLAAQKIQTVVPGQPVIVGTAFLVQYIISGSSDPVSIDTPVFDGIQLVSGPNIYKGNATIDGRSQPIQNVTYTLIAEKTGLLKIAGLNAVFKNGGSQKS